MPAPSDRFIAAATRSFADNPELEIAARGELEGFIADAGASRGDSLEEAAQRLETTGSVGKWIRISLYLLTATVSLLVWGDFARSAYSFRASYQMITGLGTGTIDPRAREERLVEGKTREERLLLLGDSTKSSRSDRFKALWDSDPENPAYFSDYATVHSSDRGALPKNFLATSRELDPGNAWFISIAAAVTAKESLNEMAPATLTPGGAKLRPVKDQAKLDEAISLFHEAAQAKRFESYQADLLAKRIQVLPPRTDVLEQMLPLYYVAGTSTLSLRLRALGDAVAIKANQLAKAGDTGGFLRLSSDWDHFSKTLASARYASLVDMLVTQVVLRAPLKSMAEAARDLGLPEEEKKLQALEDRFAERKAAMTAKVHHDSPAEQHGSLLAKLSLSAVGKQSRETVPITDEELKPGRMADHALAGRLLALLSWLVLGLMLLGSFLYRFRASPLIRALSARMLVLVRPVDWAWIIGVGVVLPLAYHQAIQRLTSLNGQEWSLMASRFIGPGGQMGSALWLMILLPLLIARWRFSLRADAVGLESRTRVWTWLCVVLGIAALPAFGAAFGRDEVNVIVIEAAGALLGVLKLCVLIICIRAVFGRRSQLLRRVTLSRILVPVYATAMLLMLALFPIYHSEEKYWIERDDLTGMTTAKPGMTGYEYDVTQQLRREVLEILNSQP